jgi:hypothetical protein
LRRGHEPHVLEDAFFMHRRFMETRDIQAARNDAVGE